MATYNSDRVGPKARVFEADDLDDNPVPEASAVQFVQAELRAIGKRLGVGADHIWAYASVLAMIEESAFTTEVSCGEIIDEEGYSNMAHLRGDYHQALYNAKERQKKFWQACSKTKTRREALRDELESMKRPTSAEQDLLDISENLPIPGSEEVLCFVHYYDCECKECE